MQWVPEEEEECQLLLEVQTYGRAFQESEDEGKVILAKESVKVFANLKPKVTWDAESAEHFANVSNKRLYIAVPTLKFVEARLLLARKFGVGVAIRELGAEFDAALDLLPHRRPGAAADDGAARGGEGGGQGEKGSDRQANGLLHDDAQLPAQGQVGGPCSTEEAVAGRCYFQAPPGEEEA